PPWVGELLAASEILGPWPLREVRSLPRWHRGRAVLVGDAAHAMSPSAGQGASLALEDVQSLVRALRDHREPPVALAGWEAERRPRVEQIARVAARNASGKAPSSAMAAWLRDRLLSVGLRFGAREQERPYGYVVPT
ncbi:MAG: FAD-dependent monooxygenase, partial [Myxococcales bacterium]|nr:FAD-dependent monooxygenase [Myxococcales bacterium]